MFTTELITIAKQWNQPRGPTTDEWLLKTQYIYTTEYYSAIKKNEIMPIAGKWMDLEIIVLSKISQAQKVKYCMFWLISGI
jgi:hypothetical protein